MAGETQEPAWWEERIELEFDRLQHLYFTAGAPLGRGRAREAARRAARHAAAERPAAVSLAHGQLRRDRFVAEPATIDASGSGLATDGGLGKPPGDLLVAVHARVRPGPGRPARRGGGVAVVEPRARRRRSATRAARPLAELSRARAPAARRRASDGGGARARRCVAAADGRIARVRGEQAHAHLGWVAVPAGPPSARPASTSRRRGRRGRRVRRGAAVSVDGAVAASRPRAAAGRHEEAIDCARRLLGPECQPPPALLLDRLARAVAATDRGDPASARTLLADAVELRARPRPALKAGGRIRTDDLPLTRRTRSRPGRRIPAVVADSAASRCRRSGRDPGGLGTQRAPDIQRAWRVAVAEGRSVARCARPRPDPSRCRRSGSEKTLRRRPALKLVEGHGRPPESLVTGRHMSDSSRLISSNMVTRTTNLRGAARGGYLEFSTGRRRGEGVRNVAGSGEHIKALVRSHASGDDDAFYAVAAQIAAQAARKGHNRLAERPQADDRRSRRRPSRPRRHGRSRSPAAISLSSSPRRSRGRARGPGRPAGAARRRSSRS